jgi:hypothetical protein
MQTTTRFIDPLSELDLNIYLVLSLKRFYHKLNSKFLELPKFVKTRYQRLRVTICGFTL